MESVAQVSSGSRREGGDRGPGSAERGAGSGERGAGGAAAVTQHEK